MDAPVDPVFHEDPYIYSLTGGLHPDGGPLRAFFQDFDSSRSKHLEEYYKLFTTQIRDLQKKQIEKPKETQETNVSSHNEEANSTSDTKALYPEQARQQYLDICEGIGEGQTSKVWLDDRENPLPSNKNCPVLTGRNYNGELLPSELHLALSQRRFKHRHLPNACLRRLYARNLSPLVILALAMTVPFDHVEPLREAIWKHLFLQTSLRVTISHVAVACYTLEYHSVDFPVRHYSSRPELESSKEHKKPNRTFFDLSSMFSGPSGTKKVICGAFPASFSAIVSVSSLITEPEPTQHTCYAFADDYLSDKRIVDDNADDSEDDDDDDDGDDEKGRKEEGEKSYNMQQDLIIGEGVSMEANRPIRSPLLYFLRLILSRNKMSCQEWRNLVDEIAVHSKEWDAYFGGLSSQPETIQNLDVRRTYNWIRRTINELNHLQGYLTQKIDAWARFSAPDGGLCHFSTVDGHQTIVASIRSTFEDLREVQKILEHVQTRCRSHADDFKLDMAFHAQHATLNANKFSEQLIQINFQASKLARQTTELATSTQLLTRMGFMMGQFYIPVAMGIALYTAEREVFPFKRTAANSFGVTVCLFIVANIAAYTVYILSRSVWVSNLLHRFDRILVEFRKKDQEPGTA